MFNGCWFDGCRRLSLTGADAEDRTCTTDGVGIGYPVCTIDAKARTCTTDGVGISHPVCPIDAGLECVPLMVLVSVMLCVP